MIKYLALAAVLILGSGCGETTKAGSGLFNRTNGNQQWTVNQTVTPNGSGGGTVTDPKTGEVMTASIINVFGVGKNAASQEAGLEGIKANAAVAGNDQEADQSLKDKKEKTEK